jgi:hypothetical protein
MTERVESPFRDAVWSAFWEAAKPLSYIIDMSQVS